MDRDGLESCCRSPDMEQVSQTAQIGRWDLGAVACAGQAVPRPDDARSAVVAPGASARLSIPVLTGHGSSDLGKVPTDVSRLTSAPTPRSSAQLRSDNKPANVTTSALRLNGQGFGESLGEDFAHPLVACPSSAGVEQALRVRRGKVDGQPAEAVVVGRADRRGVTESGPGLHRDAGAGAGGSLRAAALAHLGLPAGPYGGVERVARPAQCSAACSAWKLPTRVSSRPG